MPMIGDKQKREFVAKIFRKRMFNQGLDFFSCFKVSFPPDWDVKVPVMF